MKFIIHHDENVSSPNASYYIMKVLEQGMVSDNGKAYCYVTTFGNGVRVLARKIKTGHSFWVTKP